jgi:4-hydroxybenzoate polyprenyltransferase
MGPRLLERIDPLRRLFEADRAVRWATFGVLPFLWLALAWEDARLLIVVPIACFAIAASHRFGPIDIPERDDERDVL